MSNYSLNDFPLVVKNLSKIYETNSSNTSSDTHNHNKRVERKKALNDLNLLLKNNEIFGLLG